MHCFALLNIALLCITLLTLLCFYTAVTTSEHAKGWSALPSTYMLNPIFYVCFFFAEAPGMSIANQLFHTGIELFASRIHTLKDRVVIAMLRRRIGHKYDHHREYYKN